MLCLVCLIGLVTLATRGRLRVASAVRRALALDPMRAKESTRSAIAGRG